MNIIGTFISVGLLWFLITLFTRSTNSSQTLRETWIVVIGMLFVSFVTGLLLSRFIGPFTAIVDIAALYFLVDKICGASQKVTIRICAWYLGLSVLVRLFFGFLSS